MEIEFLPNVCRICLKKCNKLSSLYTADEDDESPRVMLTKIGIKLEDENVLMELPKQICRNCICELNLSYQFREKALQAQCFIEECLKKNAQQEIVSKIDQITTENSKIVVESLQRESNLNTQEIPNENNEMVEFLDDDCYEVLETTDNNLSDDVEKSKTILPDVIHVVEKTKLTTLNNKRKWVQSEKFNLAENVETVRKLSKRGRKPKAEEEMTKQESKYHVCEICGNVFTKRGRLTEHLRRHETEAKYACELCDERFLMREALRRHMFQHLGGKPYKCDYCSRTFFYESVKKTHEAIHAGHKPYVCDNCNKAFAYPHALKKHKLIHAQIKLFSCKYCKKDFRLQHHMKQHQETKAHQNAVQMAILAGNK